MKSEKRRVSGLLLFASILLLPPACVNLAVTRICHEQFTTTSRVMKVEVENVGRRPAAESMTTLELKNSQHAPYIEYAIVATRALIPGESVILPMWAFPPSFLPEPGYCLFVRAIADSENDVDEGWFGELNNVHTRAFTDRRFCPSCDLCCADALPSEVDWRDWQDRNWVTPVKDQGSCGSCWAYSSMAVIEAKKNVEGSSGSIDHIDLFEGHILKCSGAGDCDGGSPARALQFAERDGVIEQPSGWMASLIIITTDCDSLSTRPKWGIDEYGYLPSSGTLTRTEAVKHALLCRGPLAAISVNWEHAVLIVGWTDTGFSASIADMFGWSRGCWIIKNSWGTGWSGDGYGLIPFSGHRYSDLADITLYARGVKRR